MIPFVCGGYLSFIPQHTILLQEMAPDLFEKTAPMVQMRVGIFLYDPPSVTGFGLEVGTGPRLSHLATMICQSVCR